MVSEDRKVYGLNFVWDIKTNIAISNLNKISNGVTVQDKNMRARVQPYFDNLRIKAPTMGTKVATLSGGNQQKVVIARSLNTGSHIIIMDEPTRASTSVPRTIFTTSSTRWRQMALRSS